MLTPVRESDEVFDHSLLRSGVSLRAGAHDSGQEKQEKRRSVCSPPTAVAQ